MRLVPRRNHDRGPKLERDFAQRHSSLFLTQLGRNCTSARATRLSSPCKKTESSQSGAMSPCRVTRPGSSGHLRAAEAGTYFSFPPSLARSSSGHQVGRRQSRTCLPSTTDSPRPRSRPRHRDHRHEPHVWVGDATHKVSTLDLAPYTTFTLITGIAGEAWARPQ